MNEGLRLLGDFYNNYETIDPKKFDPNELYKKLIKEIIPALQIITDNLTDETIPITQITIGVISEGFVKEAKFIEVNLNLKEVQKALKLMDFDDRLERTISMLTGFKTSSL